MNDFTETGRHEHPIHNLGLNNRLFRSPGELTRFRNSENMEIYTLCVWRLGYTNSIQLEQPRIQPSSRRIK